MDLAKDGQSSTSAALDQHHGRLQSMEDFLKDQAELEASQKSEKAKYLASNPSKKQEKASLLEVDRHESERTLIEKRASEAIGQLGTTNWIGLLLEYRNAHPPTQAGGLTYTGEVVNQTPVKFTSTVVIEESLQHFGGDVLFSNKKDAKKHASKKAIDWLIEHNFMPADGSVKFPKAPQPPTVRTLGPIQPTTPSSAGMLKQAPPTSYAGQIPELCIRLGFNVPMYQMTKCSGNSSFWNGYAHFNGDPKAEGKVGEVRSVHGKSNAKEQIAMEVLSFLKDIERQRIEAEDEEDEEEDKEEDGDRKRKRKSVSSEILETSVKAAKVIA